MRVERENDYRKNPARDERIAARERRERERQRMLRKQKKATMFLAFAAVLLFCFIMMISKKEDIGKIENITDLFASEIEPIQGAAGTFPDLNISEEFLTVNKYSRPGTKLENGVKYIVIHYTGNPGATGEGNRNYFESLKDSEDTYASSHFVIGLDGEIIQCIPLDEMSYASNDRNVDSISIECCHPDDTGNFTNETYNNCVYLVAQLSDYYDVDMDHIIRHYDVSGKNCPKYFVEYEDRWNVFLGFVEDNREEE